MASAPGGQKTSGVRSVLALPAVYRGFQRLIGSPNVSRTLVDRFLRVGDGDRILDIGCGPAGVLALLPDVHYVGFDPSASYIENARERFGDRGTFFVAGVDDVGDDLGVFDVVMAKGVLHHLSDDHGQDLFRVARRHLRPGGRVVTIDAAFVQGQARIARALARLDRGQGVRTPDGYEALALTAFPEVAVHVRHDLLRVPYSHVILEATAD